MVHRDARGAWLEEREGILARLAAIETEDADEERAALLHKLESVRRSLEQAAPVSRSPLVRSLRIVAPCPASWANMQGDHRVRHCSQCERKVYDLTAMQPDEIEPFLLSRGEACVRMYARPDGRYQDGPCVPGERRRLRRAAALAASLGLGGVMALLSTRSSAAVVQLPQPPETSFDGEAFLAPLPEPPPLEPSSFDPGSAIMMGAVAIVEEPVTAPITFDVTGGPRRAHIEQLFEVRRRTLAECYDAERGPEGVVEMSIDVLPSGRMTARVESDGGVGGLAECVVDMLHATHVGPGEADAVRVQFTFGAR